MIQGKILKEQLQRERWKTGGSWVIDEARSQKRKGEGKHLGDAGKIWPWGDIVKEQNRG